MESTILSVSVIVDMHVCCRHRLVVRSLSWPEGMWYADAEGHYVGTKITSHSISRNSRRRKKAAVKKENISKNPCLLGTDWGQVWSVQHFGPD